MIYFIELWSAKPSWIALSTEERGTYMAQVGGAIQGLLEQGAKVITWSENDKATTRRAGYDYLAIWTFPTQKSADGFQEMIEKAGWFNYFEQVNVMGKEATVEDIVGHMIQL